MLPGRRAPAAGGRSAPCSPLGQWRLSAAAHASPALRARVSVRRSAHGIMTARSEPQHSLRPTAERSHQPCKLQVGSASNAQPGAHEAGIRGARQSSGGERRKQCVWGTNQLPAPALCNKNRASCRPARRAVGGPARMVRPASGKRGRAAARAARRRRRRAAGPAALHSRSATRACRCAHCSPPLVPRVAVNPDMERPYCSCGIGGCGRDPHSVLKHWRMSWHAGHNML